MTVSLVDRFVSAVEPVCESASRNIWWTGVALTSAIMNRLVWTNIRADTISDRLFGNLFILLIGPPGVGKTTPINWARPYARRAFVRLGPDDIGGERLIDFTKTWKFEDDRGNDEGREAIRAKRIGKTAKSERSESADQPRGTLALFLNEFDHLFKGGSADSLKRVLTDFYDCRDEPYIRETYSHGKQSVEQMCMTMIGAATPSHMARAYDRDEWQEGLPSRFIYVWAGDALPIKESFVINPTAEKHLEGAVDEVRRFVLDHQKIGWAADASAARKSWRKNASAAGPIHPLLVGYNTRRYVSACKLALVLAVARQSRSVEIADWSLAIHALADVEADIDKALAQAGGNELRSAMVWAAEWVAAAACVPEAALRRKLGQMLQPYLVNAVIEEMTSSKMISRSGEAPTRIFGPGSAERDLIAAAPSKPKAKAKALRGPTNGRLDSSIGKTADGA